MKRNMIKLISIAIIILFSFSNAAFASSSVSVKTDKNGYYIITVMDKLNLTGTTKVILPLNFSKDTVTAKYFERSGKTVPATLNTLKNVLSITPKAKLLSNTTYTVKLTTKSKKKYVMNIVSKIESTPNPSGVATNDLKANVNWIAKNLNFWKATDKTAHYYPLSNNPIYGIIDVLGDSSDPYGTNLVFHSWGDFEYDVEKDDGTFETHVINGIDAVGKKLFKFYLPTKGDTLYKMVDDFYSDKSNQRNLNKNFTFDGRKVRLQWTAQGAKLNIYIGAKK